MVLEGTYLNILKANYGNSTTNFILNGEKLKISPLKSAARQGFSLLPLLCNIVLEVIGIAIRQEREIQGILIGREEVKFSLFSHDMLCYIENP